MHFLTETTAPSSIAATIASASEAKLAVAFWGFGAAERLGITRHGPPTKIICNLESGACNPLEIRQLLKLSPHVEVRSNPRLHAKVYWTPDSVLIGSSNASSNGLAVEGDCLSSWAEANVLLNTPAIVDETEGWFDRLFEASAPIREKDLAAAEEVWKRRRVASAPGVQMGQSILAAYNAAPDHPVWARTHVTYWQDHTSEEANRAYLELKAEHSLGDDFSFYEDWEESLSEGDWILDFQVSSDSPEYQGLWYVLPSSSQYRNLTLVRKRSDFNPDGFGTLQVTDNDLKQLAGASNHFISASEDERNAIVSIKAVVDHLRNSRPSKQQLRPQATLTDAQLTRLKAKFDVAMFKIYGDAKAAGYPANRFFDMIQKNKPIDVARRLALDPNPSPGFLNLKFLNRIDLTVEHLVVQDPWSALFEPEVIAAAKRKLSQYSGS